MTALVAAGGYRYVVVDTLARYSAGMDENSRQGMDAIVDFTTKVHQASPRTSVMLVHHTSKTSGEMRGSGSLFAAADFVISLERPVHREPDDDQPHIDMKRTKNKYGQSDNVIPIRLAPSGKSLVPEPVSQVPVLDRLPYMMFRIGMGLGFRCYGDDPAGFTAAEAKAVLREDVGLSQSGARRHWLQLEEKGEVIPLDPDGTPANRTSRFTVASNHLPRTPEELRQLALSLPRIRDDEDPF